MTLFTLKAIGRIQSCFPLQYLLARRQRPLWYRMFALFMWSIHILTALYWQIESTSTWHMSNGHQEEVLDRAQPQSHQVRAINTMSTSRCDLKSQWLLCRSGSGRSLSWHSWSCWCVSCLWCWLSGLQQRLILDGPDKLWHLMETRPEIETVLFSPELQNTAWTFTQILVVCPHWKLLCKSVELLQ